MNVEEKPVKNEKYSHIIENISQLRCVSKVAG